VYNDGVLHLLVQVFCGYSGFTILDQFSKGLDYVGSSDLDLRVRPVAFYSTKMWSKSPVSKEFCPSFPIFISKLKQQ